MSLLRFRRYMLALHDSLLELIRRTSAEIPNDVQAAILQSLEREKKGSIAESALKIIEKNMELAKQKSQPICQDTGSIIFYVDAPSASTKSLSRRKRAPLSRKRPARGIFGKTPSIRSLEKTTAPTWVPARPRSIFINTVPVKSTSASF